MGLGDVQGRAVIGRPLHLEIPVVGGEDLGEHARCMRVLPEGEDVDLVQMSVRLERRKLILTSPRLISQPVFRFKVRIGCPAFLEESYVVLADPPERFDDKGRGAALAVRVPSNDGARPLTVATPTTLRLMSRQRYPGNSATRVKFIQSVAAANPEVFASESVAYDQVLLPGTQLMIPLAWARPTSAAPVVRTREVGPGKAEPAARRPAETLETAKAAGKGRLVIGASNLPASKGPTTAELSEALDRLTEAMNEQAKIELAAIERLTALETELNEVKRRAAAERAAIDRLEGELRKVQEQAERDNMIKLVLAVLLGGIFCAIVLRWLMDRRNRRQWVTPSATIAVDRSAARPSGLGGTKARPKQDDLDDLLPPPRR